jgi:hypothetical protein
MPLSSEEDEFLEVASSSLFRVIEMIAAFPVEHRAGAFEVAEHRYMQAARDFGCAEEAATRWVAAIMRKLRTQVEQKSTEQG